MIATVTFNPSLDYVVRVDDMRLGAINRTTYEQVLPGGLHGAVLIVGFRTASGAEDDQPGQPGQQHPRKGGKQIFPSRHHGDISCNRKCTAQTILSFCRFVNRFSRICH